VLRQGTFRYTVQARCELTDAVGLLSDFGRQEKLHPLIVRVRRRPARPGAIRSYSITDRLALGPLRWPITYQADVLKVTGDEVVSTARQWPRTTVDNHARLRQEPEGVVGIDVEITLSAPAPLYPYAFRQARSAHLALASRLRAALDRDPTA
jgi:hypothetical protein